MDVSSFKLVTGEEIIARVTATQQNENGKIYQLEMPLVIHLQNSGGRIGMGFMPWTLSNSESTILALPESSVVVKFAPSLEVEKQYLSSTSKIALME